MRDRRGVARRPAPAAPRGETVDAALHSGNAPAPRETPHATTVQPRSLAAMPPPPEHAPFSFWYSSYAFQASDASAWRLSNDAI